MNHVRPTLLLPTLAAAVISMASSATAQGPARPPGAPPANGGPPGWFMSTKREVVKQFDRNADGWLNKDERQAARAFVKEATAKSGRPRGPGHAEVPPPKPGVHVSPADVKPIADANLYAPLQLRTLFLEFEDADWESELSDFFGTDVEVPATLIVDGKKYPNVGVHFRGASSFLFVGSGFKRSLNVTMDFVDPKQRLYGQQTLNLLNSHDDPTFLHTVLFLSLARRHLVAPKANFVKLAINGESWGVYVNAQQFNKDFLDAAYPGSTGPRWKVKGSPWAKGGLDYVGPDVALYKQRYTIKTKDDEKSWKDLIALTRTLTETPLEKLEAALQPILDINQALWFLALDNAFVNGDGYWVRGSDYSLSRDKGGKFHVFPHDANETFPDDRTGPPMGFGGSRGGAAGGAPPLVAGTQLDPLVGMNDASKPLRSRLLAVPRLRALYLEYIRSIALVDLDWAVLGPQVAAYAALIGSAVQADSRKLSTFAAFQASVAPALSDVPGAANLKQFVDRRRAFLLAHPAIKQLPAPAPAKAN